MGEVKSRAAIGSVLLAGRTVAIRALGLASNLLLARLLVPSAFGEAAIGLTVLGAGTFFVDSGIGMGVVRRKENPTMDEMQAIAGFQLVVAAAIAIAGISISLSIGGAGEVTALMMSSLPLMAMRGPALLHLDRQLDFTIRVRIEVAESLTYFFWVCGTALLGFGVWSIASAVVVKTIAGALLVAWTAPYGVIRPRLRYSVIKPLLAFGIRFQGGATFALLHDMSLTALIGAAGGLGALGYWTLAGRILQLPQVLFDVLWGLGIPTYSRVMNSGEDVGPVVARSVTVLTVVAGLVLTTLGGCGAALVPLLFGHTWDPVALILPGACLALILSAPTNICLMGALYAAGDATTPLRGSAIHAVFRLPLTYFGVRYVGIEALGYVWLIGQAVELPVVLPRIHRVLGYPIGWKLVLPASASVVGSGLGSLVVHQLRGHELIGLVAGGAASVAGFLVVIALFGLEELRTTASTLRRIVAVTRARRDLSDPVSRDVTHPPTTSSFSP